MATEQRTVTAADVLTLHLARAGGALACFSDPDKLEMQGHWSRDHFVKVKEMGTKLVRIPIHPVAWRERTPSEYLKLLDQAVGWCTELCGKGISWTVWCFDPEWGPTLIRNWDYQLNASGEFAKAAMNGEIK